MNHESRVNSFVEFCRTNIDPFTGKPYEISARSVYGYISGAAQFPVDLMLPLVAWSLDEKLMAAYNMKLPQDAKQRMKEKIEKEKAAIADRQQKLELMIATVE